MTIKKLALVSAITLSSLCPLAHADPFYEGTVTTADHGFLVSVEGGYARLMNTPNSTMNGSTGSSEVGGLAWGANLAYAWPLDAITAFDVEVGYANNGRSKYTGGGTLGDKGTLTINSQDVQLLGGINSIWDSGINAFFKLGVAVLQQKADLSSVAIIDTVHVGAFNNTQYYPRPMLVTGIGYKITPSINLYLEASAIFAGYNTNWSDVGTTPSSINGASAVLAAKAGISYAFSE